MSLVSNTTVPGLSVPNLEALDDAALDNVAEAFGELARIAHAIRAGRKARASGDHDAAQDHEARVERHYWLLPQSLRWR